MGRSSKGSAYEREICQILSLWWTDDEHDDVFWRTAGSGGRARRRGRKNKQTKGHHGDIAATSKEGEALTDLVVLELKKGYNKISIIDILDKPKNGKPQQYEVWIEKCKESCKQSRTPYWMIIHKRDRREALVIIPSGFYKDLENFLGSVPVNRVSFAGPNVRIMTLRSFLGHVDRSHIEKIAELRCSKN